MWGLFFLLVLLIPLLAVILDSQLGRALARRIEGGAPDNARVGRLEGEVERLTAEVERLREQAEFTTRLLEERGGDRRLKAGEVEDVGDVGDARPGSSGGAGGEGGG